MIKNISYEELIENSEKFEKTFLKCNNYNFPTIYNRIKIIANDDINTKKIIEEHANKTRIIIHEKVINLIDDFLQYKITYGNDNEKSFYKNMNRDIFIKRLFLKRPLVFLGKRDITVLRDGTSPSFDVWINDEKWEKELGLNEYLTYDEIEISSLIGVSSPTYFINNGERNNLAIPNTSDNYEKEGIYIGLVGAKFERLDKMESKYCLASSNVWTKENGYGTYKQNNLLNIFKKDNLKNKFEYLKLFAKFYNFKPFNSNNYYFPTYKEIINKDSLNEFVPLKLYENTFMNVEIYKKRMQISFETLLLEANDISKEYNKNSYIHVVGLGLGVWQKDPRQGQWIIDVFEEILNNIYFSNISVIDFSWFPETINKCGNVSTNNYFLSKNGNNIKIKFSKRSPADKLIGEDENKLLISTFAWDGNSFPGNEYWWGSLGSSSDPAAVCCSTIGELMNPYINTSFINNVKIKYKYNT